MRKSCSTSIPLPYGTTLGRLLQTVKNVPDEATVTVRVSKGDRPYESDTTFIEFNWTEEVP